MAVSADHKELKKTIEHESDGDTNVNWRARNDLLKLNEEAGKVGYQRMSRDHSNYSINVGQNSKKNLLYIDLRPDQTCHSKDGGSDTFRWQLWEEIASAGLADNMGQGKISWYSHRLMRRKRVTCELHDSYFCLMTIKHAIPKILSGRLNDYITR